MEMDMLQQYSTMCKFFQSTDTKCKDCPLTPLLEEKGLTCKEYLLEYPLETSTVIQEWFYRTNKPCDLIDRQQLLKDIRTIWVNNTNCRDNMLVYLEIEDVINGQPRVLPPEQVTSLPEIIPVQAEEKPLWKNMKTFKDLYQEFHSVKLGVDDYPAKGACTVFPDELESVLKVCGATSDECHECWNTLNSPNGLTYRLLSAKRRNKV